MARTSKDTVSLIRTIVQDHTDYWDGQSTVLKQYKNAYENRFWDGMVYDETMIRIETADCFSYVEGYIAALFSKSPAVIIGGDAANTAGDPELAQAAANRFLFTQREQLEIASRLSLIYPNSFLKLSPTNSDEMLDKVSIRAIPPWEVIVDRDASSWDGQRFVGHKYYLTIPEAKQKFGSKTFTSVPKEDYFSSGGMPYRTNSPSAGVYGGTNKNYTDLPDDYQYIQVIELYDLGYDALYFWSPNYKNGEELLEKMEIPVRTFDDRPLPTIAPLYYARKPDRPMEGLSAVGRVYDQFYEKNILRTYWANAVRRDSRQYLYKEGAFDEEELAKITAGIDGAMISVDAPSLEGLIKVVDVPPISSNFDRYLGFIESDINRGSILAPFTRGEATRATATEITALAQYSASEIGKLARDRDSAIETIANIYLRQLSLLAEEGEKAVLNVKGNAKIITTKDLHGKFRISALDQGNQPLADAIKKQNLLQLLPILTQLGVPNEKLKEGIVRAYDLPEDYLKVPPPPPAPEPQLAPPIGPQSAPAPEELGGLGPTDNVPPAGDLARQLASRGMA
jgi:hypothetical protein